GLRVPSRLRPEVIDGHFAARVDAPGAGDFVELDDRRLGDDQLVFGREGIAPARVAGDVAGVGDDVADVVFFEQRDLPGRDRRLEQDVFDVWMLAGEGEPFARRQQQTGIGG